jgi:hypothetical protein
MPGTSKVTLVLLLNTIQAKEILEDPYKVKDLPNSTEEYHYNMQTLADLCIELYRSQQDNSNHAKHIEILTHDLETTKGTIRLLQALPMHTSIGRLNKLPHSPKFPGNCKELLNFILTVYSKLTSESTRYIHH